MKMREASNRLVSITTWSPCIYTRKAYSNKNCRLAYVPSAQKQFYLELLIAECVSEQFTILYQFCRTKMNKMCQAHPGCTAPRPKPSKPQRHAVCQELRICSFQVDGIQPHGVSAMDVESCAWSFSFLEAFLNL